METRPSEIKYRDEKGEVGWKDDWDEPGFMEIDCLE